MYVERLQQVSPRRRQYLGKMELFPPSLVNILQAIQQVEVELDQELVASSSPIHHVIPKADDFQVRKLLKMPSLKWSTVGGEEVRAHYFFHPIIHEPRQYLIEVKKSDKRPIPASYLPAISK